MGWLVNGSLAVRSFPCSAGLVERLFRWLFFGKVVGVEYSLVNCRLIF